MIFSVKDSLRQAVEAASGGLCTVMYTKKGQPVFLRRIPRFNLEDIDSSLGTGPHPAFVVNGETRPEFWLGMYIGTISNGELVSVPSTAPSRASFATHRAAAEAAGPGFHMMTLAEWAAVVLLHWKMNGGKEVIRGNTDRGRSHEAFWETAVRVDGYAPGDTRGTDHMHLTGSGPLTWRHDGTAWGIADLRAPTQYVAGLRLVNTELQIIPGNNAALNPDSGWRAILPSGALVDPESTGTIKITTENTTENDPSANVPALLRALLVYALPGFKIARRYPSSSSAYGARGGWTDWTFGGILILSWPEISFARPAYIL